MELLCWQLNGTEGGVGSVDVFCNVLLETALSGGTGIVMGLCRLLLLGCSTGITTMFDLNKDEVVVAGAVVPGGEANVRSFFVRNCCCDGDFPLGGGGTGLATTKVLLCLGDAEGEGADDWTGE